MTDSESALLVSVTEKFVLGLREVGLYEDKVSFVQDHPIAILDLYVGDLAFSKRVQNPDQVDIDKEFRLMMGPVTQDQDQEAIEGLKEILG